METLFNIPCTGTNDGMRYIDLFVPKQNPTKMGILFIHGGGWSAGNKEQFHSLAAHFCSLGYTCASVSYRLSGQFKFPAQLEDARLAMAYLKRNAEKLLLDPRRIVSFGSSAGGHLALLLALYPLNSTQGNAPDAKVEDTRPCAVVAYCPVTDLKRDKQSYAQLMVCSYSDAPDLYRTASPIDQPLSVRIPMLIINGDADTTTPLKASEAFCQKVWRQEGVLSSLCCRELSTASAMGYRLMRSKYPSGMSNNF